MAKVTLKLGTYRKLNPTLLEEFIFFDHPSGRARIRMAMDWEKAWICWLGKRLHPASNLPLTNQPSRSKARRRPPIRFRAGFAKARRR